MGTTGTLDAATRAALQSAGPSVQSLVRMLGLSTLIASVTRQVTDRSWRKIVENEEVEARVIRLARLVGMPESHLPNFLATLAVESGFRPRRESHRYDPARAQRTFTALEVLSLDKIKVLIDAGPEVFFEAVYGYKTRVGLRSLGNRLPGDGYKYRGAGLIQLTGRDNMSWMGSELGEDLLNDPDKLVRDLDLSIKAAIKFWQRRVGAAGADIVRASKIVNGGKNALDERVRLAEAYGAQLRSA